MSSVEKMNQFLNEPFVLLGEFNIDTMQNNSPVQSYKKTVYSQIVLRSLRLPVTK